MSYDTDKAGGLWQQLDALRTNLLRRCEVYASYTLPYLWNPLGGQPDQESASKEWQSIGAQAVNHLVTRLMLTLFSPSRPFIRLDPGEKLLQQAADKGMKLPDLEAALSAAEKKAVKKLDQLSLRPKLFEVLKHLVVFGNVLMILTKVGKKPMLRVISLKNFVVKRDINGRLHTLVIRERVCFDELTKAARAATLSKTYKDDEGVDFFIKVCRDEDGEGFTETQWIGDDQLTDAQFTKKYTDEDKLPYRVLTWNLRDEGNYGSGLVEDCEGDFAALSTLSRAVIEAAVLASEYRWVLSPAAQMKSDDFEKSANGSVIPGMKDDLQLVNAAGALGQALQVELEVQAQYVNRIGKTFLLSSAVTRDAERVTAEEIRMLAQELETGLGGGYSRLAVDVQLPLGVWLLTLVKVKIVSDDEAEPTVVTGLDALSRNGDLDNLDAFIKRIVEIGALPPEVLIWLKLDDLFTDLGTMTGVTAARYVRREAEVRAIQQAQMRQQVAADAAVKAAGNKPQQPQGAAAQ